MMSKRNTIESLSSGVMELLALTLVLLGVIMLAVIGALGAVKCGVSAACATTTAPALGVLLGYVSVSFQLQLYSKISEKWAKIVADIPFLALVGGGAAAQFILEAMWRVQVFDGQVSNLRLFQAIYFGGCVIVLGAIVVLKCLKTRKP